MALVTRLNTDMAKFFSEPTLLARAEAAGILIANSTAAEFADGLKREFELVGRTIKAAGIQSE